MDYYKGSIPILNEERSADRDHLYPGDVQYGLVPPITSDRLAMGFEPPAQIPTIPESDWDAIYDEQEKTKSSLEHIYLSGPGGTPAFVNLDQNGNGFCTTEDTEILTTNGWVKFPEYDWNTPVGTVNPATHELEFQKPFQRHVYEYDGPMLYSTNRRLDFGVTPDHQLFVRKWDERRRTLSDHYSFVRAADLGWYAGFMAAPRPKLGIEIEALRIPGSDRSWRGDDFIKLMALIVADGFAGSAEKNWNVVSFCCFDERYPTVKEFAAKLGFTEQPKRRGVWYANLPELAAWVRSSCYSGEVYRSTAKRLPTFLRECSARQIRLFLDWYADKSNNQYSTASKQIADDLQELHLRIGVRASIGHRGPRTAVYHDKTITNSGEYTVYVATTDRLCVDKKKHIETERYKGLVYCVGVPNHTMITRRNGDVLISSNCWAYSTTQSLMIQRLRDNQPLIRLSAHAVASIIKGGRDEGGWCGLSAKFAREVGIPSDAFWRTHSRDISQDTPALRANAKLHRVTEEWVDMSTSVYNQNLTKLQSASSLMLNMPGPRDFNWWSHSVCSIRWVRIARGNWGLLILNSWLNWGRYGLAVLEGQKAICDGGLTIRSSTISGDA